MLKNVEGENLKKPELKTYTEKMLTFVDLNATQAAIRAGYKVDNARQTATENLTLRKRLKKPLPKEAAEKLSKLNIEEGTGC